MTTTTRADEGESEARRGGRCTETDRELVVHAARRASTRRGSGGEGKERDGWPTLGQGLASPRPSAACRPRACLRHLIAALGLCGAREAAPELALTSPWSSRRCSSFAPLSHPATACTQAGSRQSQPPAAVAAPAGSNQLARALHPRFTHPPELGQSQVSPLEPALGSHSACMRSPRQLEVVAAAVEDRVALGTVCGALRTSSELSQSSADRLHPLHCSLRPRRPNKRRSDFSPSPFLLHPTPSSLLSPSFTTLSFDAPLKQLYSAPASHSVTSPPYGHPAPLAPPPRLVLVRSLNLVRPHLLVRHAPSDQPRTRPPRWARTRLRRHQGALDRARPRPPALHPRPAQPVRLPRRPQEQERRRLLRSRRRQHEGVHGASWLFLAAAEERGGDKEAHEAVGRDAQGAEGRSARACNIPSGRAGWSEHQEETHALRGSEVGRLAGRVGGSTALSSPSSSPRAPLADLRRSEIPY